MSYRWSFKEIKKKDDDDYDESKNTILDPMDDHTLATYILSPILRVIRIQLGERHSWAD